MKNGNKKIYLILGILAAVYIKNMLFDPFFYYKNNPSISQYLNRLIEFFDSRSINSMQDIFLQMIDHGLSPKEAFNTVIMKGLK